ncbi:putative RNA-directed DNA polymerase from transposon X-element [Trichonephila clavipes]|nr:putative RNA-directed DNA polymerase from transposon X-element [Trichonephila clavipes]
MTDHANGNSSRAPDAVTRPEKIDSLSPNVHCARIRTLQKLIRYAETRIRYQQELIDIETFDQRDTDAAQLQSYIHAKGATELDYNMKLGKERQNPAFVPLLLTPNTKETNSNSKKPKTNDKNTSNNTTEVINRKELPENTIPVNNPFSVLTIDDNDMEVAGSVENRDIAQPKHGEITNELKEKGEEFYAVPNPGDRPLKMVLKGLPSNTDIDDIKYDLANQGLPVMKVAQLTQRKSKFPLPLFLVEVRKNVPDSRDIRDISTCCYMSITWDSFRRRPGPSQCYNCNYFHHSSLNCSIKTRCLKCGQEQRTSCPITEKIENPKCINCNAIVHMANWSQCPKFPKTKPKKGDAQNDRNKNNINENRPTFNSNKTTPTISYANAAKSEQQMAARKPVSEPATNSSESNTEPNIQNSTPCSDIFLAIREFRNFFTAKNRYSERSTKYSLLNTSHTQNSSDANILKFEKSPFSSLASATYSKL